MFNDKGQLLAILWGAGGFFSTYSVATTAKVIIEFAHKNNIHLFSAQNQNANSLKNSFDEDAIVTVLCSKE